MAGGRRLPTALRPQLARPFGPVVATEALAAQVAGPDWILAVGDVVSLTLKRLGITPKLFVCDFQTQRGKPDPAFRAELGSWGSVEIRVRNPPGLLSAEAEAAVRQALAREEAPVRIVVDGEEDLLGLPCLQWAPLGSLVLYGMPGRGVAVVRVTPQVQAMARDLLEQFEPY